MDRLFKSNTVQNRTHPLFRQGCMLYDLLPNMSEHRLTQLVAKFAETLSTDIPRMTSGSGHRVASLSAIRRLLQR